MFIKQLSANWLLIRKTKYLIFLSPQGLRYSLEHLQLKIKTQLHVPRHILLTVCSQTHSKHPSFDQHWSLLLSYGKTQAIKTFIKVAPPLGPAAVFSMSYSIIWNRSARKWCPKRSSSSWSSSMWVTCWLGLWFSTKSRCQWRPPGGRWRGRKGRK